MAFNRKIWLDWKTRKPCPTCNIGVLTPPTSTGHLKTETAASKEMNSYGGQYYSEYVFSVHFKCNNCGETVAISGIMSEENEPRDEEKGIQITIVPKLFYPSPKIIEIPKSCPSSVSKILNETFSLYWLDLGSCANKIRITIEVLMDEQKVPQTQTTSKGIIDLTLHKRLELFEKSNPSVSKLLMAIKWIGNAGSHFFEIEKEGVLDAYQILEFALEKLYNDREQKVMELSDEINKSKKPIKK